MAERAGELSSPNEPPKGSECGFGPKGTIRKAAAGSGREGAGITGETRHGDEPSPRAAPHVPAPVPGGASPGEGGAAPGPATDVAAAAAGPGRR